MIKACIFDFGGVLTTSRTPDRVRPIAERLGIDWAAIERGYAKYRLLLDGDKITMDEMYRRIFADARASVAQEELEQIIDADIASFLHPNMRTLAFMRELKSRGFALGILTNMYSALAKLFRVHFAQFVAIADAMVVSGEVGICKPQRGIYEIMQRRIGFAGGEICFFDDVEENCRGAREAGWNAIRFADNDQIESDFERLAAAEK